MIKNIANFLGILANVPVKGVIPRYSEALTKFAHNKLPCSNYT